MDACFGACIGDDCEGITSSDLDRFTDNIENVLNDEKGRGFFKKFMTTCKMRSGIRTLKFWEHIDTLLNDKVDPESPKYQDYLDDFTNLVIEAERIDELDLATMETLQTVAREERNKNHINETLKKVKAETTKALKREYNAFRRRYVQVK